MTEPQRDAATDLLIQEVDEDLRREQYARLWKQYGSYAIGAALALVLGVAGLQGYKTWTANQRARDAQTYNTALGQIGGNRQQALADLGKLAADSKTGYATLAPLTKGALLEQAGDTKAAIAEYEALANASAAPPLYRELAALKAAILSLDSAEPAALKARLEPLAKGAYRHSATELLAMVAVRQGDVAQARSLYQQLADDAAAPVGLRGRASEMLAVLAARDAAKQG